MQCPKNFISSIRHRSFRGEDDLESQIDSSSASISPLDFDSRTTGLSDSSTITVLISGLLLGDVIVIPFDRCFNSFLIKSTVSNGNRLDTFCLDMSKDSTNSAPYRTNQSTKKDREGEAAIELKNLESFNDSFCVGDLLVAFDQIRHLKPRSRSIVEADEQPLTRLI